MAKEKNDTSKKTKSSFTSITIPFPLAGKIKARIEGSGFTSLSSYVTFVLREILGQVDDETKKAEKKPLSTIEKEALFDRLKNLGYI
ncbi:CopG family transcriptional regulator [Candidatus Bathyarchaeota archaeon]|nr:CopG family transcriptional regulator [Candidatus Bathyarchaeota archaeon]